MLKRLIATVAPLLVSGLLHAQIPASPHFTLQKLADGVYAAIANDTGFAVCNAGIVDLGDAILVWDPFISPRAGADLRQSAVALTGKPVLYVVNSHYHNDHIRGDQEFPGAHVVSSVFTRKAIAESEPEEISWENANVATKLSAAKKEMAAERNDDRKAEAGFWVKYYEAIQESHASLRTVLPDVTFEGKLVLHGPQRSVELIEIGRGHTESDLILYLPAEGIAFLGDLLFINRHPYLPDGFPADWLRGLEKVAALRVRVLVPGHGPVGNPLHLDIITGYIKAVGDLGAELAKRGATEQEIASQPIPPAYRTWWFSRFFLPNVKFMVEAAKPK